MENKTLDNIIEEDPGLIKRTVNWIKKYPDTALAYAFGTALCGLGAYGYIKTKSTVLPLFCAYVGIVVSCLGAWSKEITDNSLKENERRKKLREEREEDISPLQEEFDRLVDEMHERHKQFFKY